MGSQRRTAALLVGLWALAACRSAPPWDANRERLEHGLQELHAGDLASVAGEMNALVADTQAEASQFPLQRFFASFLAAQAHAAASLDGSFLTEHTTAASRIGGIGQREEGDRRVRPSTDGHLVASVYHASVARALYARAAQSGPKRDGVSLVPEELWNLGVDNADANLQLILTTAYSRMGFGEEVRRTLDSSPDLHELTSCMAALDRYGVQQRLRPWICAMLFDYLRSTDELNAYRFGVMAVEGDVRFGQALPPEVIARIEDWIVNGASVQFVCPDSQTPYLPGQRRSPISGIPHLDYVPVERR